MRRRGDHLIVHAAHQPDPRRDVGAEQQFLAAGGGARNVNGGEDAPLLQGTREVQFHIAGALELLVNHVIHAGAGIHQAGGDDGQRAALFDVAGCAEEPLGRVQRRGVNPARKRPPGGVDHQVVRPRETGDRIHGDEDIASHLHQPFGAFQHHLGHPHMIAHRLVEGG